jgi:acyl transferase domain-containing protein
MPRHLESTSFLASVSKICSMFEHRVAPPNSHITTANPKIRWEELKMYAPTETTPLTAKHPSGNLLVSLGNYGISGVNVHAVLESRSQTIPIPTGDVTSPHPVLLVAAGLSPKSTTAIASAIPGVIDKHGDQLDGIATTYGLRSKQMTWKSFAVYKPGQPLEFSQPAMAPRNAPPVVFVISGQGPQHFDSESVHLY